MNASTQNEIHREEPRGLGYQLIMIPATVPMLIYRWRVGIKIIPVWRPFILVIGFFIAAFISKNEIFYGIAGVLLLYALMHAGANYGKYAKGGPPDPWSEGDGLATGIASNQKSKDAALLWQEPGILILMGIISLWWLPLAWASAIIFCGLCLHLGESIKQNRTSPKLPISDSMDVAQQTFALLKIPKISSTRIKCAYLVAVIADAIQFPINGLGLTFFFTISSVLLDGILDVGCMVIISLLLGFHWVLLPSFVMEGVPVLDLFPTWTMAVAYLSSRRKAEAEQVDDAIELNLLCQRADVPANRLEKIAEMHRRQLITQEEYDAKRQQILDAI